MGDLEDLQVRGRGPGDETEARVGRSSGTTPLELTWALVPLLEDDGAVVRVMVEFARRGWLLTVGVEEGSGELAQFREVRRRA